MVPCESGAPGIFHASDRLAQRYAGNTAAYTLLGRQDPGNWEVLRTVELPLLAAESQSPTLSVWPNPISSETALSLSLPGPLRLRLAVYDLSGRLQRVLSDGPLGAGSHEFAWDGRDDRGVSLPSGVYLLRSSGEGILVSRKLVLLR